MHYVKALATPTHDSLNIDYQGKKCPVKKNIKNDKHKEKKKKKKLMLIPIREKYNGI